MLVTKADGTAEQFKSIKLRTSLRKAGAQKGEISMILSEIERGLYDGITTQEIYRKAFELLRSGQQPAAAKYSLRRALFGLGPTGFPFEDFLARLFFKEGYTTRTRIMLHGTCAQHEIDIAAYSKTHSFVGEAKFHSRPGVKSDLQVALYSYARYLDLKSIKICKEDTCGIDDYYIITNTKFTHSALRYAECVGLRLLSWDYPHGNSLQKRIEAAKLYPITVLSSLSNKNKQDLLRSGTILCDEILKKPDILSYSGIPHKKTHAVIDEARQLCSI